MSGFSGAVKLGDLNDFINPSQNCVVALTGDKLDLSAVDVDFQEAGEVILQRRGAPPSDLPPGAPTIYGDPSAPTVKVSLSDCLACSGCVTSAETVLLEAQSADEFRARVRAAAMSGGRMVVVVSVSPQSRASLARAAGLDALDAAKRLTGFFKTMGVARVLDTTASRDLSLLESCEEFVSRYRNAKHAAVTNTPPPSPADVLPVLTSACPGWVCYAEKTHGGAVLNHVSAVKSPQQVMGCIVKRKIAAELGVPASAVFHATVMPCFDKKLEASREDFAMDDLGENVREVDCVLTTGEVAEMIAVAAGLGAPSSGGGDGAGATLDSGELGKGELAAKGAAALALVNPAPLDGALAGAGGGGGGGGGGDGDMDVDAGGEWLWGADAPGGNSGSGGYLDAVFRHAAKVLHGVDVTGPLKYATPSSRNLDLKEVTLEVDGAVVLRFAAAYGFRNIQNIVRKCKAGSVATGDAYDFVEIMACPSGCLNGGGQLPPPPRFEKGLRLPKNFDPNNLPPGFEHLHASNFMTARDLVDRLDEIYRGEDGSGVVAPRAPGANPFAAVAYGDGGWVGGGVGSERARRLFHTRYHDRKAEAEGASGAVKAARDVMIASDW